MTVEGVEYERPSSSKEVSEISEETEESEISEELHEELHVEELPKVEEPKIRAKTARKSVPRWRF
jgi:hypothetical protein